MSRKDLSRRGFICQASAGAAAVTAGAVTAYGNLANKADTLAALGGTPVRTEPIPKWPQPTADVEKSLVSAFRSAKWGRTLGGKRHGSGQVGAFEDRFAKLIGTKHCLATGSCTQSLHTALHSVGVDAGDEVLVAPCTYLVSIQAVLLCNALPVFVDVDLDTFQMDPGKIEPLVNENTRVVEPVHIGGIPCSMDRLMAVANKHKLKVVEDAAQAHLAEFNGKKCGTFGDLGCFSFQSSKVVATGEGGAIVGNDSELMEKCYTFHNLGLSSDHVAAAIEPAAVHREYSELPHVPEDLLQKETGAVSRTEPLPSQRSTVRRRRLAAPVRVPWRQEAHGPDRRRHGEDPQKQGSSCEALTGKTSGGRTGWESASSV